MKSEYKLNGRYEILTDEGFKDFSGISQLPMNGMVTLTMSDGTTLKCSLGHRWVTPQGKRKACELSIGDTILSDTGELSIASIDITEEEFVSYDIVEVEDVNRFYVNGVLSSNCDEFAFVKPHISRQFYDSILPTLH